MSPRTPPRALRLAQRLAVKAGVLDWEQSWLRPLLRARREALGVGATGPPRFLVRVDEFPTSLAFEDRGGKLLEASRRLHDVLVTAGVPYLMAVLPEPAHDPLDPDATGQRGLTDPELELIHTMLRDGVTLAQHGTTHRTLHRAPRRHSELVGLDAGETAAALDRGRRAIERNGIHSRIFVPPFNRFASSQWPVLAERYDLVCGGPESIALVGLQGGPLWHGDAVYLPCYSPLYAPARDVLPAVERMIDLEPGTWIPVVLHTAWESGADLSSLASLAERLAPFACSWDSFLENLGRSRA